MYTTMLTSQFTTVVTMLTSLLQGSDMNLLQGGDNHAYKLVTRQKTSIGLLKAAIWKQSQQSKKVAK